MNKSFPLLNTIKFGPYNLKNRVGMAALTRMRADASGVPNDLLVKYYTERAESAGFVLTECSPISVQAEGFPGAGGIYTDAQIEGWKKVIKSVHKVNGKIYLQIWHAGRSNKNNPMAPSPIGIRNPSDKNPTGWVESNVPREMTEDDILQTVEDFRKGAQNALAAGFDGIQLHGANGYLIDEFLRDGSNKRTDKYGGSIENRIRFPLLVMDALISVFGADKVGIKLSPVGRYQDMFDSDPGNMMKYILVELSKRKVAFVEIVQAPDSIPVPDFWGVKPEDQIQNIYKTLRPYFNGVIIGNNHFDWESGNKALENGVVDMITFGRAFMSNPDLVERFTNGWPLNQTDFSKAYGGGAEGYCDYAKYQQN